MPTIREVYNEMTAFHSHAVEAMTIRLLLSTVNGIETMSELYIAMDQQMKGLNEFQRLFARVLSGEPVQYVLKKTTFCGISLFVDERVLIPRPETEELIDKLTQLIRSHFKNNNLVIADVGTGSGCIAFGLEKYFPKAKIMGTDISKDALDVASFNSKKIGSHVSFLQGDLLIPLIQTHQIIDVLVSNPPYIENAKETDDNVIMYEPHLALFAPHGIDFYERIFKSASLVLHDDALMFFEINHDQEVRLSKLAEDFLPYSKINFMKDLQGKTRFMSIVFKTRNDKI